MTRTTTLIERIDLTEAALDTERRSISGVVLIRAGKSANGRLYREAVLEAAAPVFAAAKAYANHPRRAEAREGRSVRDLTGFYTDVVYREGALRATRHFLDTEAGRDAWAIARAIAEGQAPASLAGLSINAVGTATQEQIDGEDVLVVEAITHALSVDDVDTPAAGGTYLAASADGDSFTAALLASLSFDEWFGVNAAYVKRLQNEWKTMREADSVKAAKAEADANRAALQEAKASLERLQAERDAAVTEMDTARRALAIAEALGGVALPAAWKADLREQLGKADPDAWGSIIEREQRKAKAADAMPRARVTGAGQQVSESTPAIPTSPVPLPGEDVAAWQARLKAQRRL